MKIDIILAAPQKYREAAMRGKPFKSYPPQTLNVLANAIIDRGHDIRCMDQNIMPIPEETDAQLVAISANTCSVNEAYRLSSMFRNMGVKTVIGGSHATAMPEEAMKYADSVAIGPGEGLMNDIINDCKQGHMKSIYNGFQKSLYIGKNGIRRRNKHYFPVDTVEMTRGCPNSCSFCAISGINNGQIYCMTPEAAYEHMEQMGKRMAFLDSNPMEHRDYFIKIMHIARVLKKQWVAACTLNIADDNEMMDIAAQSGCIGLLVGIESVNRYSLQSVNKINNNVSRYTMIIRKLHDRDIGVLGTFVLGLDHDDKYIFERTYDFVNRAKIDMVKYGIMTPLPGTEMFRELKANNRIKTYDWSLYDTEHVVYEPRGMSADELLNGYKRLYRQTYSYKSIFRRIRGNKKNMHLSVAGNIAIKHFADREYV